MKGEVARRNVPGGMMTKDLDEHGTTAAAGSDAIAGAATAAVRQALVESHRQLLGFLNRRLGSAEEAGDVMQTFMLRAIDRAAELRDIHAVRGWLSRILATSIADHQRGAARRRQREAVMSPESFDAFSIEPDTELDEAICNCLYKLLPTLKPQYAEVIRRVDLLEESREQVAASLGVSVGNLGVRLHRARQALKQRLVDMCITCPVHGFLDCGCETAERARRRRERLIERSSQ